jgi:pimeloyl-ACP methyl ester carboxylesterase
MQWYLALLARAPVIDPEAFQVLLADFWQQPRLSVQTRVRGPVSLLFGEDDPLVDPAAGAAAWQAFFPSARSRILPAGHFIQLERPPAEWWPPDAAQA